MLEERERAYKEGLTERLAPRTPSGERVEVVAACQAGPPWLQLGPLLAGIVLVAVSLIAGALPAWVGGIGALGVLVGIAAMMLVPRRIVARTNRAVRLFPLPRATKAAIGPPLAELDLDELPPYEGGVVRLGGERLWPNYGSGIERDALARALAPPD